LWDIEGCAAGQRVAGLWDEGSGEGLETGNQLWEELSTNEARILGEEGYMVSSAFVHWEGMGGDGKPKGLVVQNFKRQSKWWTKCGSVKTERPVLDRVLRLSLDYAARIQN
jgi:hypothetical protein